MHEWLVFSAAKEGEEGLFCKYCVWFTAHGRAGYNQNASLGYLVTKPLSTYKYLSGETGDLCKHARTKYHQHSVALAKKFIDTYNNPQNEVINQVQQYRLDQVQENRSRLRTSVDTVLLCGRNNIPLRGHRDDGTLVTCENQDEADPIDLLNPNPQEGIFRKLLRYRAAGDGDLAVHLRNASSRATYISKSTQNELIYCCGQEILDVILG